VLKGINKKKDSVISQHKHVLIQLGKEIEVHFP